MERKENKQQLLQNVPQDPSHGKENTLIAIHWKPAAEHLVCTSDRVSAVTCVQKMDVRLGKRKIHFSSVIKSNSPHPRLLLLAEPYWGQAWSVTCNVFCTVAACSLAAGTGQPGKQTQDDWGADVSEESSSNWHLLAQQDCSVCIQSRMGLL